MQPKEHFDDECSDYESASIKMRTNARLYVGISKKMIRSNSTAFSLLRLIER